MIRPLIGQRNKDRRLTQSYGNNFKLNGKRMYGEIVKGRNKHEGLDYAMGIPGTKGPVHSCTEGTVEFVGVKSGFGNTIVISYDGYKIYYAHLDSIIAKQGEVVKAMQEIGIMGKSGTGTGIHLHLGLMKDGERINPTPYITDRPEEEAERQTLIDEGIFNGEFDESISPRLAILLTKLYKNVKGM